MNYPKKVMKAGETDENMVKTTKGKLAEVS